MLPYAPYTENKKLKAYTKQKLNEIMDRHLHWSMLKMHLELFLAVITLANLGKKQRFCHIIAII